MDTVTKDSRKLLAKINGLSLSPGLWFLFHDTCSSTLEALPAFIEEAKIGYEIVPFDKLLHLRPYA